MLNKLTHSDFAAHLNQTFRIHLESIPPLEAELIDVAPMGSEPQDEGGRWAFSIVLRGPREPVLPQQIYPVEHEQMGTLDLFLVPLGPDKEGNIKYEAVFT
jgi:hypothetical protein